MRRPRELQSGFWNGFSEWWDLEGDRNYPLVHLELHAASASELRRMAKWMVKAARWMEWKKKQKRGRK